MGFYEDRMLPRIVDLLLGNKATDEVRARVCEGLDGEVLEVGFGSGRNVPHYPAAVTRVRAVDPATAGRKLAARGWRPARSPSSTSASTGRSCPLDDASVDHVLVTWTLCTIPDPAAALAEMRRVLRPGGSLHFVEHGHSPDAKVATWQARLNPIQRRLFGGCHLDRPIDDLVTGSGFEMTSLERYYAPGPKAFAYFYEGTATR